MESEMGRAEKDALGHYLFYNNGVNLFVQNIVFALVFQFPLLKERGWGEVRILQDN